MATTGHQHMPVVNNQNTQSNSNPHQPGSFEHYYAEQQTVQGQPNYKQIYGQTSTAAMQFDSVNQMYANYYATNSNADYSNTASTYYYQQ